MNARPLRTTLIALAVGMTLASGMAMAQDASPPPSPGAHHNGPPPGGPAVQRPFGGPLLAGVDLSEAQRAKIDAIVQGNRDAMHHRFKDVMKAHEDLDALAWSGHFDDAQARRIAQGGAQAMVDIAVAQARTESELFAVLTPAQRAQAQANREKFKEHRFGPPPGGPRPGDHGPQDGPPPGGQGQDR